MTLLSEDLRAQLASGQAVIVAGAGVSLAATGGAPLAGWSGLLEDGIARCAELADVPAGWDKLQRETLGLGDVESWLAVAEQVTIRLGGRAGGEFRRWLHETVGTMQATDDGRGLLDALIGLGVPICTTNYDGLIDEAAGVDAVTWRDGPRAQMVLRGDEPGVVHLHGFWRDPASVILGVRSYGDVLADGSAQAMLKALATMRSLVLVGFGAGLDDPNFRPLRAWMAQTWPDSEYRHYRLVSESEREAALAGTAPDGERIQPVVYGTGHDDLEVFVRGLTTNAPGPRRRAAPDDVLKVPDPLLPAPRPFFGREDLVERLADAVLDVEPRPIPVLGPPGIGKSALAQACAHDARIIERFGERRFWVHCDGADNAASVAADIALALGITGTDSPDVAIVAALTGVPSLLVLDNAETPWEGDLLGTEELLSRLAAVPELALVGSFRGAQRPIGVPWTDSILVPPLRSAAAEQVFLAAAGQRFATDPSLSVLLADLDGMPIAIELLGRLAQPETDLDGLRRRWEKHRTDLLTAGGDPDRHLSVAVSFDLSINNPQLSDVARGLLSVLARLPDGVLTSSLDEIFDDGEDTAAELRRVGLAFDEGDRVRVLKPIRDHVAAHYPASSTSLERASAHYRALAQRLGAIVGRKGGARAVAELVAESANLSFAISQGLDGSAVLDGIDAALALTSLGRLNGLPVEHLTLRAAERAREHAELLREAHALFGLGQLARSDNVLAQQRFEQALPLYQQIGNVLGEANCIQSFGDIALERSDHDAAREAYDQALPLFQQIGNALGEANCIQSLGDIALRRSDHQAAREAYDQALPLFQQIDSILGEANCIQSLGDIALERSDHDAAREAYDQALPLFQQIGNVLGEANCIQSLGDIALERSDHDAAREAYDQALPLFQQIGNVLGEANCIKNLGDIALACSDRQTAREAYDHALPLYQQIGNVLGEANCIQSLGDIALRRSDHQAAREAYDHALPLYQQIDSILGEANCIQSLGDIALACSDRQNACEAYDQALTLYNSIPEPYSIGNIHVRLAGLSDPEETATHRRHAREAWRSIDREDLIERYLPPEDA